MNNIINEVNKITSLFSDEDIINEYNQMQNNDTLTQDMKNNPRYIALYLYNHKGNLTKEEYKIEVMNYLYQKSLDSKDVIDKTINDNQDAFYDWYESALHNKITFFHAVQYTRNSFLHLLHY